MLSSEWRWKGKEPTKKFFFFFQIVSILTVGKCLNIDKGKSLQSESDCTLRFSCQDFPYMYSYTYINENWVVFGFIFPFTRKHESFLPQ